MNTLLSGYDESDGRVARLLKRAGYLEQRQSYCVVVAQSANPGEMESPARAQRIATAVADALAGTSIRALSGIRDKLVTMVLSDKRRQSGWTPRQTDLSARLQPLLLVLGPSVLVGISADYPSTAFIPKARHEAVNALAHATVARRVVAFADLSIRDLLLHRGGEAVKGALPNWAHDLVAADSKAAGALVLTLRAIADADMNIQQAARQLGKHANTVYARLEKIKTLTARDGQRYHELTELLLAADAWRP